MCLWSCVHTYYSSQLQPDSAKSSLKLNRSFNVLECTHLEISMKMETFSLRMQYVTLNFSAVVQNLDPISRCNDVGSYDMYCTYTVHKDVGQLAYHVHVHGTYINVYILHTCTCTYCLVYILHTCTCTYCLVYDGTYMYVYILSSV